jgi:hypothetical protein
MQGIVWKLGSRRGGGVTNAVHVTRVGAGPHTVAAGLLTVGVIT